MLAYENLRRWQGFEELENLKMEMVWSRKVSSFLGREERESDEHSCSSFSFY